MVLSKDEANGMQKDLQSFRYTANSYAGAMQLLSTNHDKLLSDYKAMLNEYEECKDARDEYKRLVRPGAGNPFVLALIDGDNYLFNEVFVRQSSLGEGGRTASGRLWAFLTERLSAMNLPPETKVVVKYIVNLSAASVEMHRLGAIGSHSRALAPFAAAFGKEHTLFDVVDSGELNGATDAKMQDNFRLFIENPSCRHIFFAGCNTEANFNMLTDYERQPERITLVRNSKSFPEYFGLGLRVVEMAAIFREKPEPVPTRRAQADDNSGPASRNGHPAPTQRMQPSDPVARDDANLHKKNFAGSDHGTRPGPSKRYNQWPKVPPLAPAAHAEPSASGVSDTSRPGWQSVKEGKKPVTGAPWIRGAFRHGSGGSRRHEAPMTSYDAEPLVALNEGWSNPTAGLKPNGWNYKVFSASIDGQGGNSNVSGSFEKGANGHPAHHDSSGIAAIWSKEPQSPSVSFNLPEDDYQGQTANGHGPSTTDADQDTSGQTPPPPENEVGGSVARSTAPNIRLVSRMFDPETGTFREPVTSHQSSSGDEQRGDDFHSSATMSSSGSSPTPTSIQPVDEKQNANVNHGALARPNTAVSSQDARVALNHGQVYRHPHQRSGSGFGLPNTGLAASGFVSPGLSASRHAPSNFELLGQDPSTHPGSASNSAGLSGPPKPVGTPAAAGSLHAPTSEPRSHPNSQMSMAHFPLRFGCGIPSHLANNSTDGYQNKAKYNGDGANNADDSETGANETSMSKHALSPSPPLPKACISTSTPQTTLRAGAAAFVPTSTVGLDKDSSDAQLDVPAAPMDNGDQADGEGRVAEEENGKADSS